MKNRIKELRLSKGITQAELAKTLGIAQNTLSYWENGKYDPDNDSLKKIASYFGVSVDYILNSDNILSDSLDNIVPFSRIERRRLPMLGDIACGTPIEANEEHEYYVESDCDFDADFCLRAKGDSMIGARINSGDVVFIKKQPIVENGEIAAVVIGDEATLKRVYYYPEKNMLILKAENSRYDDMIYMDEELDQVHIIGKAVAFQSIIK